MLAYHSSSTMVVSQFGVVLFNRPLVHLWFVSLSLQCHLILWTINIKHELEWTTCKILFCIILHCITTRCYETFIWVGIWVPQGNWTAKRRHFVVLHLCHGRAGAAKTDLWLAHGSFRGWRQTGLVVAIFCTLIGFPMATLRLVLVSLDIYIYILQMFTLCCVYEILGSLSIFGIGVDGFGQILPNFFISHC